MCSLVLILTGVPHSVLVEILLVGVGESGAVVTYFSYPVIITVQLVWWKHEKRNNNAIASLKIVYNMTVK